MVEITVFTNNSQEFVTSDPHKVEVHPQPELTNVNLGKLVSMQTANFRNRKMLRVYRAFTIVSVFILYAIAPTEAQTEAPAPTACASRSNTSCDECLKNVTCLWCITTRQCIDYPVRTILPPRSVCPLPEARWGLCWVNFQTLIITMSVLAGVIIIAIFVCCFCCCKCERVGNKREDATVERQARARKARQDERKTEMKLRHDEIRQKYGLAKGNPYSRMEDN